MVNFDRAGIDVISYFMSFLAIDFKASIASMTSMASMAYQLKLIGQLIVELDVELIVIELQTFACSHISHKSIGKCLPCITMAVAMAVDDDFTQPRLAKSRLTEFRLT